MTPGLEVRGLEKAFGATRILDGVDVTVPRGGFCVLLGASGCGKSTLLRAIAGLDDPTAGQVLIDGVDVTRAAPRDRDIAMVFQSYALYPHMTVRENLAFGLSLRKVPAGDIATRVGEAAELLGLTGLLDRLPRALSGGQRQRVAMGRAIVRRPKLFLFDEPLSNLDAALRAEVRVEIRKLHERLGATSVYVTHDQVEAMTLADTLVLLRGGKVEQVGPPLEVYRRPRTEYVAAFLGSPPMAFLEGRVGDEGVVLRDGTVVPTKVTARGGEAIKVGIRPEDLSLGDGEVGLDATVERVEALGGDTVVFVETPAGRLVARASGRVEVARGARVRVGFRGADVAAFGEGGLSVRA